MEKYIRELDSDLQSLTLNAVRSTFAHVYYTWRVLRHHFDRDKALQAYGSVWDAIVLTQISQSLQALGINEVKDIATLGRIINYSFSANPDLYETIENTPNCHIGHIHWCVNPAYGPSDCTFNRHSYYREAEVPLTIDPYIRRMVETAKKMGLRDDVEWDVPVGRCRDGNASFCQILVWKKGTPKPKVVDPPASEKVFVEDQMGDEEPLIFILKKQGKTLEEFGPGAFTSFFFVDMATYDGFEKTLGKEKASDIYTKLWLTFPLNWVREARLELELGRVTNLEDLAKIVVFCEKKRYVPYKMVSATGNQVTLIGKIDPFAEIPVSILDKKLGDSYFKAVRLADGEFIKQVLVEANMADKAEAIAKKRLVDGDDRNEIVIQQR